MKPFKNLLGAKFGKLLVIEPGEDHVTPSGTIIRRWVCRCDCGKIKVVRAAFLINGHTKSCGCGKGRKPEEDKIEACVFFPATIDCTKLKCEKCGWNPNNEELRKSRIMKL
jgi:hypothetical protein